VQYDEVTLTFELVRRAAEWGKNFFFFEKR